MAGRYNFSIPGRPDASVVNQGTITAQTGGFAALVAPGVRNSGTITARLGKVSLASGNAFSLDFYGDSLITLGVSDSVAASVKDVATGQTLKSLVSNEGMLKADGGKVELTAVAARQVVDSVINNKGVIEANTIGKHNGMIVLGAATAASKPADAPTQTVKVSGTLSAAGKNAGETGGKVQITGESDPGRQRQDRCFRRGRRRHGADRRRLVGWQSRQLRSTTRAPSLNPTRCPPPAPSFLIRYRLSMCPATTSGNGGKAIVWADQTTTFGGTILARGGTTSGDGGFVETSGHALNFVGAKVDASAHHGHTGSWLLDPTDLTINAAAASTIATNLATSDVTVQTNGDGSTSGPGSTNPGFGDIIVASNLSWSGDNSLFLSAYRNIVVNDGVTISNTSGSNIIFPARLYLRADNSGTDVGTVIFGGSAKIDFSAAGAGSIAIYYNPPGGYANPIDYSADIIPSSSFGLLLLGPYMLVNNINDLQNIQQNLSGTYALGKDIDASSTASWNGGAGFLPIGTSAHPFNGVLNGGHIYLTESALANTSGHSINNLTINSSAPYTGLFGYVGNQGSVSDVHLINANVAGVGVFVGAVAGWNQGHIETVFSMSGSVTAPFGYAGGIAGYNDTPGFVGYSNSSASVQGQSAGGLVGTNAGFMITDYATGPVAGGAPVDLGGGVFLYSNVGGLVGANLGTVELSFATGAVSNSFNNTTGQTLSPGLQPFGIEIGGLVGANAGTINYAYTTGAVSGGSKSLIGSLVGYNGLSFGAHGTIDQAYAVGPVSGGPGSLLGGLVGYNDTGSTVTAGHWNYETTGLQSDGAASGTSKLSTSQLTAVIPTDFVPDIFGNNHWLINAGATYPYLFWQPFYPQSPIPGPTGPTPPAAAPTGQSTTSSLEDVFANGQIKNLYLPVDWQIAGPTTPAVITNLNAVQSTPTSTPTTQPNVSAPNTSSNQQAQPNIVAASPNQSATVFQQVTGNALSGTTTTTWGWTEGGGLQPNSGVTSFKPIDTTTISVGGKTVTLNAYANLNNPDGTKNGNGTFQCTALISAYLYELGFRGNAALRPGVNGIGVAQALGTGVDKDYFQYSTGQFAPKVGAIVSFNDDQIPGHVAIIKQIQPGSQPNTLVATLIEQNATIQGSNTFDVNRKITFTFVNGTWTAQAQPITGTLATDGKTQVYVTTTVKDWVNISSQVASLP